MSGRGKGGGYQPKVTIKRKNTDDARDSPDVDALKKRRIEWIVQNHVIKELQPVDIPQDVFFLIFKNIPVNSMIAQQLYTINKQAGEEFQERYKWESERYSCFIHELPAYNQNGNKGVEEPLEDDDEVPLDDDGIPLRLTKKQEARLARMTAVVKVELPEIRRGDVILFGYTREGKMMWDGEKVIELDYHTTGEGICPADFKIDEFPSTFYFHELFDDASVWIDLKQYTKLEALETCMLYDGTDGVLFKLEHKTKPEKILYVFQTYNDDGSDDEAEENEDEEGENEDEDNDGNDQRKKKKDENEYDQKDDGMPKLNVERQQWGSYELTKGDDYNKGDVSQDLQQQFPDLSKHNFVTDYNVL